MSATRKLLKSGPAASPQTDPTDVPVNSRIRARAHARAHTRMGNNAEHPSASVCGAFLSLEVPIKTGTGLNSREHWGTRAKRVKKERMAVWAVWLRRKAPVCVPLPVVVKLTRVSPGTRPLDDDNLRGSLKAIRDQVAEELGVDDGDTDSVRFEYAQERGAWCVRVEVRGGP